MEISGSGGILLLVVAVLWLGFMTPSGKSGLSDASKRRTKKVKPRRVQSRVTPQVKVQVLTRQNPWIQAPEGTIEVISPVAEVLPERVVVNRLPDPLSARLGKIQTVAWAEVKDLDEARVEKEKVTSESLDDIMQRRRSNG